MIKCHVQGHTLLYSRNRNTLREFEHCLSIIYFREFYQNKQKMKTFGPNKKSQTICLKNK